METKIKSVVAIVKKDIQVGKLANRSKKQNRSSISYECRI